MNLKGVLSGLLALLLVAAAAILWFRPGSIESAPDITLATVDGGRLALTSLQGRPLLVTFWATTCRSCIKEIPQLIDLYRELSPRGLEVVAIAMPYDPPSRVLAMRQARAIPYIVALDIDAAAARAFGDVRLTPTSFLIAPDGRVVYRQIGPLDMNRLRQDILAMPVESHNVGTRRLSITAGKPGQTI
jgi:peroxiredoxin